MGTRKTINLDTTTLTVDELLVELQGEQEIVLIKSRQGFALRAKKIPSEWDLEQSSSKSVSAAPPKRVLGLHAGQGWLSEDFNAELSDEFWFGDQA
jgi:hypothetical protein